MPDTMALKYLDFDYSEDGQGTGTFDAMASVTPDQLAAVHADIARVLDWAHASFPDAQGDLDEGGEWDCDLESQQEWSLDEGLVYHPHSHRFSLHPQPPGRPRHTLSLSLTGTPQFCEAFRRVFGLA